MKNQLFRTLDFKSAHPANNNKGCVPVIPARNKKIKVAKWFPI